MLQIEHAATNRLSSSVVYEVTPYEKMDFDLLLDGTHA
jgi:hypothetical protein